MYTQDEFSYFGDDNSDNPDEEIDVGEGDSERQESFNQNGKRVRGKDQEWVNHRKYVDPESFKSSDLLIELKENFSGLCSWSMYFQVMKTQELGLNYISSSMTRELTSSTSWLMGPRPSPALNMQFSHSVISAVKARD